jgi:hypothetical protein
VPTKLANNPPLNAGASLKVQSFFDYPSNMVTDYASCDIHQCRTRDQTGVIILFATELAMEDEILVTEAKK